MVFEALTGPNLTWIVSLVGLGGYNPWIEDVGRRSQARENFLFRFKVFGQVMEPISFFLRHRCEPLRAQ